MSFIYISILKNVTLFHAIFDFLMCSGDWVPMAIIAALFSPKGIQTIGIVFHSLTPIIAHPLRQILENYLRPGYFHRSPPSYNLHAILSKS